MTSRHTEILRFLYQFRFLSRNQLQTLLNHKHYNRIIVWLNELTENGYIRRYYDKKRVTVPAIYLLGNKGRKYLKQKILKTKRKDKKSKTGATRPNWAGTNTIKPIPSSLPTSE